MEVQPSFNGWEMRLTNSITSAIPAYVMQGTILPARIHTLLIKLIGTLFGGLRMKEGKSTLLDGIK